MNNAQIVERIQYTFRQLTSDFKCKDFRSGTVLYGLQIELMYLLDNIMRGPSCMLQKELDKSNTFMDSIVDALNAEGNQEKNLQEALNKWEEYIYNK